MERSRGFSLLRLRAAAVPQLDLRYLGRMLLHAALVGALTGSVGSAFFVALELTQTFLLEDLAGYLPLRASGESVLGSVSFTPFRPWLLALLPGLGALGAGLLTTFLAPEARGGGGDAAIHAFHHQAGVVRRRVVGIKALASILTLGAGGSGGREGPTMQIGGAIGSVVGRYLRVSARERRILLIAGVAGGVAAVFRTPLGAALLAVEILYRDDFESDALIPALLASVVSYSVFISFLGESTLFAHAPGYPFVPAHLPWYGAMAVLLAVLAGGFLSLLRVVQDATAKLRVPIWMRPALGGLALGLAVTPVVMLVGPRIGQPGQGLGLFGGGYGAAQIAIVGAPWLPEGWLGAELLLLIAFIKIVATSLTVGTGGSAGDFGPSLVIGGLFGGAFGRAAELLSHDPRLDPGAFALVGMGTFYGGIAHVPISSLVMVCELAGSYDLLVPLMLAEGIAFVVLRKRSLYPAQVSTKRESPAHRHDLVYHALEELRAGDVAVRDRPYVSFEMATPAHQVIRQMADSSWQDVFPVIDAAGQMVGMVNAELLRTFASQPEFEFVTVAADLMEAPLSVMATDNLHSAIELMLRNELRELPVLDESGKIVGFLDEADITRAYMAGVTPGNAQP
ncbi:MAG TPA: chloride channel protein [Polyangiaceae bacterium]|nr:chloride channel protein [Polyangiaceae bacterium]